MTLSQPLLLLSSFTLCSSSPSGDGPAPPAPPCTLHPGLRAEGERDVMGPKYVEGNEKRKVQDKERETTVAFFFLCTLHLRDERGERGSERRRRRARTREERGDEE